MPANRQIVLKPLRCLGVDAHHDRLFRREPIQGGLPCGDFLCRRHSIFEIDDNRVRTGR